MHIVFVRHGNTFEADQRAFFVGVKEDLPLVAAGLEQAIGVGRALASCRATFSQIIAAPLQRTRQTADCISTELGGVPVRIDPRLNELDYGLWAGLTGAEIERRFGQEVWQRWNELGEWPQGCGWGESAQVVMAQAQTFLRDLSGSVASDGVAIVVSSNGTLRHFLKLDAQRFLAQQKERALSIGTGKCALATATNHEVKFLQWNIDAGRCAAALAELASG